MIGLLFLVYFILGRYVLWLEKVLGKVIGYIVEGLWCIYSICYIFFNGERE